jgi:hypothetical protein
MKFLKKNSSHSAFNVSYKEKYIEEAVKTKFLVFPIGNHINWKNHIEEMISKLSEACYVVRLMAHISNINSLKSIHYA